MSIIFFFELRVFYVQNYSFESYESYKAQKARMLWNLILSVLKSGGVLDSGENKKDVIHSYMETRTNTALKC